MSLYDSPNQEVVRADRSGPGAAGGQSGDAGSTAPDVAAAPTLDEMTKAELLAYAQELGVSPANNDMTKDEIRAGVDQHLASGA